MSSLPVFLAERLPSEGAETMLAGPEGRHAAAVRRLRTGERLTLTDGCGELALCEVLDAGRDRLRLRVLRRTIEQAPALRVTLAQALVKGQRGELSVELATEAGVDAVLPWRADRCVVRWDFGPRGEKALSRWRETAREAAKQSRRGRFPEVAEPVSTAVLGQRCAAAAGCLVLHEGATDPLPWVPLPAAGELLLVVGPEGGITDAELATLTAAGGRPVRLGPGVLRSSSAGAVALGAIGALSERWVLRH
ncbi:MAG: 16S rRNA (uracil(1498)-N(3))-methyltransferase [Pseudonocardiales bacterium]|nr:16S rRNA (uracil(1498)-N(3))-methyltransferase [Pseudonocardiales bacterium]MBV9729427.1 16S rRNA (uracil(1498)-N(3))-methyltransferase [Pseudonocardiales bacterium]